MGRAATVIVQVTMAQSSWAAGAMVTSLARLNWQCQGATKWVVDQGRLIDFEKVCPKTVTVLVERSVRRWTWRTFAQEHTDLAHLSKGADLRLIVNLLGKTPSSEWGRTEKGCLEALVVGAAPSQQQLELVDLVSDNRCQWCWEDVGSYLHRHWECEGSRAYRMQYGMPPDVADAATARTNSIEERALFERALFPDLRHRAPKPSLEQNIIWEVRPPDGVFQGRCCMDGSGLEPQDEVLCRAGWAVSQIDRFGNVCGEAYGNVPGLMQHSGLGELYAFLMLLTFCWPPLIVVTDYEGLISGVKTGRQMCTAASQKGADIWRLIWDKLDDIGLETIDFVKIASHQSRASVLDGRAGCSLPDWLGNQAADKAAKKGAPLHLIDPDLKEELKNGHDMSRVVAKWIGTLGAHLLSLGNPDVSAALKYVSRAPALELIQIPLPLDRSARGWQPRVLHKEAKNICVEIKEAMSNPDAPPVVQLESLALYASHTMRLAGAVRFCWKCGCFTDRGSSKRMQEQCPGGAGTPNRPARRLQQGRHPVTNAFIGGVRQYGHLPLR